MIEFDPLHYPYASTRNVVYAKTACAALETRVRPLPVCRHS